MSFPTVPGRILKMVENGNWIGNILPFEPGTQYYPIIPSPPPGLSLHQ